MKHPRDKKGRQDAGATEAGSESNDVLAVLRRYGVREFDYQEWSQARRFVTGQRAEPGEAATVSPAPAAREAAARAESRAVPEPPPPAPVAQPAPQPAQQATSFWRRAIGFRPAAPPRPARPTESLNLPMSDSAFLPPPNSEAPAAPRMLETHHNERMSHREMVERTTASVVQSAPPRPPEPSPAPGLPFVPAPGTAGIPVHTIRQGRVAGQPELIAALEPPPSLLAQSGMASVPPQPVAARPVLPPQAQNVPQPVAARPGLPPQAQNAPQPVAARPGLPPQAQNAPQPVAPRPVLPPQGHYVPKPVAARPMLPPQPQNAPQPVAARPVPPPQVPDAPQPVAARPVPPPQVPDAPQPVAARPVPPPQTPYAPQPVAARPVLPPVPAAIIPATPGSATALEPASASATPGKPRVMPVRPPSLDELRAARAETTAPGAAPVSQSADVPVKPPVGAAGKPSPTGKTPPDAPVTSSAGSLPPAKPLQVASPSPLPAAPPRRMSARDTLRSSRIAAPLPEPVAPAEPSSPARRSAHDALQAARAEAGRTPVAKSPQSALETSLAMAQSEASSTRTSASRGEVSMARPHPTIAPRRLQRGEMRTAPPASQAPARGGQSELEAAAGSYVEPAPAASQTGPGAAMPAVAMPAVRGTDPAAGSESRTAQVDAGSLRTEAAQPAASTLTAPPLPSGPPEKVVGPLPLLARMLNVEALVSALRRWPESTTPALPVSEPDDITLLEEADEDLLELIPAPAAPSDNSGIDPVLLGKIESVLRHASRVLAASGELEEGSRSESETGRFDVSELGALLSPAGMLSGVRVYVQKVGGAPSLVIAPRDDSASPLSGPEASRDASATSAWQTASSRMEAAGGSRQSVAGREPVGQLEPSSASGAFQQSARDLVDARSKPVIPDAPPLPAEDHLTEPVAAVRPSARSLLRNIVLKGVQDG